MLESISQRLEWICRKIWILLQAFLLLLLELIPTFILQKSTSPVAQWTAGLSSIWNNGLYVLVGRKERACHLG